MSKKTIAIYKSLENLKKLQQKLQKLENSNIQQEKEITNISFELKQEIKTLEFWIDSLYKYTGKSTSLIKKKASAENGKKGGRPPKEITNNKKRITELEQEIIPDLDHKIVMADSNEDLESFRNQREIAINELIKCRKIIKNWLNSRDL